MFSAKTFNFFTLILALLVFCSATISVIIDIQKENDMALNFQRMLQEANAFNETHSSTLEEDDEIITELEFDDPADLLQQTHKNLSNANTYYSEAVGVLDINVVGFVIAAEFEIKRTRFANGDYVLEIIAKEKKKGGKYFFGGQVGGFMVFYEKATDSVYQSIINRPRLAEQGVDIIKWKPDFKESKWTNPSMEKFREDFGFKPNEDLSAPLFDINYSTLVKENSYYYILDPLTKQPTDYSVGYKLNPAKSTKKYLGMLEVAVGIVGNGVVKSMNISDISVISTIDNTGNYKSLIVEQSYKFEAFFGFKITGTCSNDMTFFYTNINKPVDTVRPVFEKPEPDEENQ